MKNAWKTALVCAPLLAGCSSLPRPDRIQTPPYIVVTSDAEETLGEYLLVTHSFKIELPETSPRRRSFLEAQVAAFDRLKLFKGSRYGADLTLPMNDEVALAEEAASSGTRTVVVPETLTVSAKYHGGKKPRVVITAAPNILDSEGRLHFKLETRQAQGAAKKAQAPGDAPPAPAATAAERARELRDWLQRKYGPGAKARRAASLAAPGGAPLALVEADLTLEVETGRAVCALKVRNQSKARISAADYLPQLTYRKGRDWFTLPAASFYSGLRGAQKDSYLLAPGAEKSFTFASDAGLLALRYDPALGTLSPGGSFATRADEDAVKMEMFEQFLTGGPAARLEIFPDRRLCADCGIIMR